MNLEEKPIIEPSYLIKKVQLYNMLGEQVLTATLTQNKSTINVKELPAGTYFLYIKGSLRNQIIKKVVIYK